MISVDTPSGLYVAAPALWLLGVLLIAASLIGSVAAGARTWEDLTIVPAV